MPEVLRRIVLLCVAAIAGACAPPPAPTRPVGEIPVQKGAGEATAQERKELEKGYAELRLGKTSQADARFRKLRQKAPQLLAARTALGYVRLALAQHLEAEKIFAEVLEARPSDLDALLGAAEAAAKAADLGLAVTRYRAAAEAHPLDATAKKRLSSAKLGFIEQQLEAARAALQEGRPEAAIEEYRKAVPIVPEVAGLRVELANLLVTAGDLKGAAEVLAGDPTGDPQAQARLGEIYVQLARYEEAVAAYRRALERDAVSAELGKRLSEAQSALEFSRMPEEYRQIFSAAYVTRADLAALINVKVTALQRVTVAEPTVAVDISGSWAKEHILKTLALDIIGVYPNHTFQPAAMIRRGDLARAVARVLDLLQWKKSSAPRITDMSASHLYYDAAVRVVGAGLMDLTPEGAFEPGQRVSGREAATVIEALGRLVGP
jgi:tetratricopeptide (TPR) repeat protein